MDTHKKEENTMASKMTASEITERINKTAEAIRKLTALIEKREKDLPKAQKKLAGLNKETQKNEWWDAYEKVYTLEDGIEGGKAKLKEKQNILKNWQEKLEKVNAENKKLTEIPEQLKGLQDQVAKEIAEYNIFLKKQIIADREELPYKEFKKQYTMMDILLMEKTDEEIRKDAEHEAKSWVLNLISRVENKVGQITKWNLHLASKSLNGWVEGTRGHARVETITAGGYNIQCLHQRVLVR